MKLTDKQEKFCQSIIRGLNQIDAYKAAYPCKNSTDKSIYEMASKLMKNPKIIPRLEELRRPVIQKLQYGLEQAMREAEEAFKVSKEKQQGGAMVAAVQLRSKLNGLLVDKTEIRTGPLDGIEHAELLALREALKSIGPSKETRAMH